MTCSGRHLKMLPMGFKLLKLKTQVLYMLVLTTDPDSFLATSATSQRSHFLHVPGCVFPEPGLCLHCPLCPLLFGLAYPLLILQPSAASCAPAPGCVMCPLSAPAPSVHFCQWFALWHPYLPTFFHTSDAHRQGILPFAHFTPLPRIAV